MNGCLIKNTPIAVDLWTPGAIRNASLFFLTHLHQDHLKNLTSSWRHHIYTSPLNVLLLRRMFQFSEDIVIGLSLNEPHIIPLSDSLTKNLTVTLLDANHIPGSVMFLFEGDFGKILYCGDMRYDPKIMKLALPREIDTLYLDNTFCHPDYNFPDRSDALQQIINIIEDHPNHYIKLGLQKIGKEELMESIAQRLDEMILVSRERYEILKLMSRPNVYTIDPSKARIESVPLNMINNNNMRKWNERLPTISIKITALYYGIPSYNPELLNTFCVAYSGHSSWSELLQFVKELRPREVTPIVKHDYRKHDRVSNTLNNRDDMSVFAMYLRSPLKDSSYSFFNEHASDIHHVVLKNKRKKFTRVKKYAAKRKLGVNFTEYEGPQELSLTNQSSFNNSLKALSANEAIVKSSDDLNCITPPKSCITTRIAKSEEFQELKGNMRICNHTQLNSLSDNDLIITKTKRIRKPFSKNSSLDIPFLSSSIADTFCSQKTWGSSTPARNSSRYKGRSKEYVTATHQEQLFQKAIHQTKAALQELEFSNIEIPFQSIVNSCNLIAGYIDIL